MAKAKGVEFIDVTAGTKALYESYGESKSAAFFPSGEKTHTNKLGAQTIAKVVAQLLYDGKTALMKYVNTEALTLPDRDSIDVVIESFGKDEVVTKKTNNYQAGDVIADSLACINGLYIRGKDTKDEYKILAETSDVSSVTFSDEDGTKLDVSVCAATQNANDYSSKIGTATAGRASADAFTRMFALNIGTSGHFYAKVGAAESGKQIKLVFSGVTKNTVTTDGTVADLDFKAENSGVIYLCANTPFRLYAAMFVPDPETGQPEDWNYQSVTTRSSGLWTYSNLSGENQSVPEGLTVYAVTGINADGKATLADIGSVIPAGGGFLVMGAANTDYALPSTTDEATYEGANLMVANSELRVLPVNEGSKTNYIFDGTKFVRASGSETIHEKQAYLSMETVVDELLPVIPEPECVNATVTLFDDSRKDRKVYQAAFGEKQKFYYMRPEQDTEARSQSYKADFAESPFTVTVQNNGDFIYWTTETIDGKSYESKHDTIVVNTIAKKPTVTYLSVEDTTSIYRIVYSKGTTLHYTIGDGEEQMYAERDTLDVSIKATGMMKVYSKNDAVVSDTTSVRAYAPTPSVLHDGVYDFSLLRNVIGADYTLTTWGYDSTLVVGGVTLNKPSAMTAKTFEGLTLTAPVKGDSESAESTDWRLLNAGRLRASKSDNDKYLALMGVKQGDYLLLNYSGASVKYLPAGTAQLTEGTDTLKSGKAYRIVTGGDLLLSIPADTLNCDITAITMTSTENVEAPTIALKNDTVLNVVRIRAGKSSLGMSVSIRYTTDGSEPMAENGILSEKSPVDLTFDENAVIKAVTVSETGATSAMSVYELNLPVSPHAASAVYTMEEMLVDGQIVCDTLSVGVYNQEYNSTESVWSTKLRTDFYPLAQTNGQVSVRNGSGSLQLQSDGTRVRLTRALAVHQLCVGDEIAFVYTGDGSLWSAAAAEGDEFTVNGKPAPAGTRIPSGAIIKVTKTKYSKNYVVVTPAGEKSGRVYIKSIYVNSDVPAVANIPSVELLQVVDTTAIYRFSYEEGEQLHYVLETDGEEQTGPTSGICDVEITKSTKVKAWTTRDVGDDHAVSETLSATLFAPTPAPSEDGDIDFADVSDELPADLEVTLDMNQGVTAGGQQLYKPSALTAATFDDKFAFSETNTSGKIKIRTKKLLAFAQGDDMSMALLDLKVGDIVAFEYTGTICFADGGRLESGVAYEVEKDGDLLLKLLLGESDVSISKMYIGEKPHRTEPTSILFATAVEEYEALEYGKTTAVYYNGKSSAQTFYRLNNDMEELPIRGKLSVEGASGELVSGGLKAGNRRVAIHGVARGDVIVMHIAEGGVTYEGHATKGDKIRVGDRVLQPGDSLRSGDVIIVDSLDYLNNYVVLKLNSKAVVTAMFINSEEVESVSMPTIVDKGKNVIQITAGKSSTGMNVTTCYTIDGTEPTELNGTSGPYEQFEVKLLESGMVTIKAITYSETGVSSSTAYLVVYADKMVYGPSFLMDENGNMYDVYNVWGQKVNALQRGQLYIVNGKKVIYK